MDQLGAMRAFVRVVESGSFSAAAREANTSQATISKRVAALEAKLGARLMLRSSRDHSLTPAGSEYYEKCVAILAELDEAESSIQSETTSPRGLLRITAAFPLGRLLIGPLLPDFLARFPNIEFDLALTDRHVDLVGEGFDLAIRAQQAPDSSLVAKPLFGNPMHVVASPKYLRARPDIREPADLTEHNCIIYSQLRTQSVWHFTVGDKGQSVHVGGNLRCDSGDVILEAAVAGIGVAILPYWMIHSHLVTGSLQVVLLDYEPEPLPVRAIYPQRRYLPLRVRCFIDFLTEKFAANPMIR
jgi:DNA-binding transcriptional LysR family regulator